MKLFAPLALVAACLTSGSLEAQKTHPFSVHDMLAMERISDAQVSPDGKWVAFSLRTTDVESNRGRTNLWLTSLDGSGARQLTHTDSGAWGARWMPDGQSLVYLSAEAGSAQLWRYDIASEGSVRLSEFQVEVDSVLPFPDGRRLLLAIQVYPDLSDDLDATAVRDHEREKGAEARIYDELLYRHWDTWEDGKRNHLFVWKIGKRDVVDLMQGWDADCPTRPFGAIDEVAISPDGKQVVFAAKKVGREAAWSTDVDLWAVPSDGSEEPRCLTEENDAYDNSPAFSPGGTKLAYVAMERPMYESDRKRVVILDLASGERRVLTEDWDRSADGLAWSADEKTLYTSASDLGNRSIFAIDATTGDVTRLAHVGTNRAPRPAGDRILFLHDSLDSPVEIRTMATDGSDVQAVTKLNKGRVAVARRGEYEQFTFPGWNGETVHGYVLEPVDLVPGTRYPVAFLVHGGPQGSFGNHFHYRWNPQAYAGAGYAAVFIDFHGSTGYGQAFTDSINQDWGGKPYEDLMKGLDYALANYDFLDGERVGALGASFGGYMVNWIAGQTDRFKCLVNHDGNLDERMAYFDTEELWFPEWDHGGTPWGNPEGYAKHNPIEHVDKWQTPMLVIHGARDYRVVDVQGMATFAALQRRGIPSRFLYFPDENHWVLKPRNSILWHDTVIDWLDRWLKSEEEAKAVPASAGGR